MKKYIFVLCIGFFANQCFAQNYVITPNTYQQGKISRHKKDQIILRQKLEGYKTFAVDTVLEFREGGTTYKALEINGSRQFYERLEQGRVTLYRLNKTYVLDDSSKLTQFNKSNFRSVISTALKCDGKDASLSKLTWTKPSIKYVVRRYNKAQHCEASTIPHRKFGIVAGYNMLKTTIKPGPDWSPTSSASAPSVGAFVDLPILGRRGRLYFTLEGNYLTFNSTYYSNTASSAKYIGFTASGVNTLGSFKFVVGRGKVKPYVKLGAIASFLKLDIPTGFIDATKTGSVINVSVDKLTDRTKSDMFGLNGAVGMEIPLVNRINLHLEVRSTNSILTSGDLHLGISNVGLNAGISF